MVKEGMPSQSHAHSLVALQDLFTGISQIVNNSHNLERLFKSRKTEISAGLCNSDAEQKAIVPVRMCTTSAFYSRLFVVPKPGKKWRPVIDLSVLNKHLSVPTFKLEMAEVIRNAICKGEWVVSIDLIDAYFHIPIHEKSQHLLRFHVAGKAYQFRALPFGIATATLDFS